MARKYLITCFILLPSIILISCNDTYPRTEDNLVYHKPKTIVLEQKDYKKTKNQTLIIHNDKIHIIAKPESIPVLVNKQNKLPDTYTPCDLVYTNIPFIVLEKSERTKMRKEAAKAIERLFASANKQGIQLLGVSAYRSHLTQTALFNYYEKTDGYIKARTYSALPGTSEHETGLAIDVTGGDGQCPAEDCFGYTKEAGWLKKHAADFGFIIRYPKGKETITGYKYEPWHLRYVGESMANTIMNHGITLEEFFGVVPVNKE